jgi:hypothetical protein
MRGALVGSTRLAFMAAASATRALLYLRSTRPLREPRTKMEDGAGQAARLFACGLAVRAWGLQKSYFARLRRGLAWGLRVDSGTEEGVLLEEVRETSPDAASSSASKGFGLPYLPPSGSVGRGHWRAPSRWQPRPADPGVVQSV